MAVISDKYRYIYVLNPRTASTATQFALIEQGDGRSIPEQEVTDDSGKVLVASKHCSIQDLRKHAIVPAEKIDGYHKFVTVRNPYDSVVSMWAKNINDYKRLLDKPDSWVHKKPGYAAGLREAQGKTFAEWVASVYPEKIEAGKRGSINRRFMKGVDRVIRYENFQDEFEEVKAHLGLPADLQVPSRNKTRGRTGKGHYREFYDDRARELVGQFFAEEIEELGYEF